MGKQPSPPKKTSLGKGKVTPVQIAFIVHRYLAENNYSSTLAAFQADAADLFAKTKAREPPRGLLSLADILDEYVTLKEQRLVVDLEKQRVEAVLRGINAAMDAYHSAAKGILSPESPPLPSLAVSPVSPTTPANVPVQSSHAAPSDRSPPGPVAQVNTLSTSISSLKPSLPTNLPSSNKRKNSVQGSTALKKLREGLPAAKRETDSLNKASSAQDLVATTSPLTISHNPSSTSINTLPQSEKMASLVHLSPTNISNSSTPLQQTPTKCSVISSKTIVVSPFKGTGYISVEKSVCITSPMKSSPQTMCRRGRVKGRLDFDDTGALTTSASQSITETFSNLSESGAKELFELDLSDFDMDFNLADLMVNIDLDCDDFSGACHPTISGCGSAEQDSGWDLAGAALPGMDIRADAEATASVRTMTKCVKVLSPAKQRR
ncbi:uncharacterized protein LOC144712748 [Wolffia australiana]